MAFIRHNSIRIDDTVKTTVKHESLIGYFEEGSKEEIIKKVKTKMCKDCGVYLGGGKCSDNCSITKIIRVLEQEPCEDCISRQTVIDTIESWLSCDDYNEAERHIMRAMQSVLYDLPPVNPQPCEGCISRAYIEPIIEELENICVNGDEHVLDLLADIKNAPSVTPQQKVGRWIYVDKAKEHARCSKCDYGDVDLFDGKPHNYCPNCGAWITGAQEREEKA